MNLSHAVNSPPIFSTCTERILSKVICFESNQLFSDCVQLYRTPHSAHWTWPHSRTYCTYYVLGASPLFPLPHHSARKNVDRPVIYMDTQSVFIFTDSGTLLNLLLLFFFFFLPFFSIPFIIFALLFSLPPSRNSDPGSHSRLFSTPTHYGWREDFSCFSFRRLASNCAYPR